MKKSTTFTWFQSWKSKTRWFSEVYGYLDPWSLFFSSLQRWPFIVVLAYSLNVSLWIHNAVHKYIHISPSFLKNGAHYSLLSSLLSPKLIIYSADYSSAWIFLVLFLNRYIENKMKQLCRVVLIVSLQWSPVVAVTHSGIGTGLVHTSFTL